ncbi:hypothetical protein PFICI_04750 [Pestalotiopsis fici W106-1]|uniref:Nephrocystin 3-like N-terminal domain-containing protein n=1 Tax=Pestalotiopsis fici (strain W106-1 / CGMCC3.15140) TaxID=1229662 RepID=W3XA18_PESFW|nr:uncharacterized protein PFICI_04750 [Pestalotiopsis fici W106-1]ETS82874.1 hypothetical protein PFICI_04750 [Pestalotiopsis fici W106-1]
MERLSDRPESLHIQPGADNVSAEGFNDYQEAIHAQLSSLATRADKTYREWRLYLRKQPIGAAEKFNSLSTLLKQICLDLHQLCLQCSELDDDVYSKNATDEPSSVTQLQMQRLQICSQTMFSIQATLQSGDGDSPYATGLEQVVSELVDHGTWIAAARQAGSYSDLINYLCTDLVQSPPIGAWKGGRLPVYLPLRIDARLMKSDLLKSFRLTRQRALLQDAIQYSEIFKCDAFLQNDIFCRWKSTAGSVLLVSGSSRTELATLAASTVHHISHGASPTSAICFFFCDSHFGPLEVALKLVKATIGQLAQQSLLACEMLYRIKQEPLRNTFEGLCCTMASMMQCFDQVTFVIEGLGAYQSSVSADSKMILSTLYSGFQGSAATKLPDVKLFFLCKTNNGQHNRIEEVSTTINTIAKRIYTETAGCSDSKIRLPATILHLSRDQLPILSSSLENETVNLAAACRFLSLDIESRSLERFAVASEAIDGVLSRILMLDGSTFPQSTRALQYIGGLLQLDLLHPTLAEYVMGLHNKDTLTLETFPTGVSTASMAIFCIRYICLPQFSTAFNKVYRAERHRVAIRDQKRPFFRYAATTWMHLARDHWQEQGLMDCVMQLFDRESAANFGQWVTECARTWFPHEIGFKSLSPQPLQELLSIINGPQDLRLHVASLMGLSHICKRLLEDGANVNEPSAFGTVLHCSLLGSAALVGRWIHVIHEYHRLGATDGHECRGETIKIVLDRNCNRGQESFSKGDMIRPSTLALLTCTSLLDSHMFFDIVGDSSLFHPQFSISFGVFLQVMATANPSEYDAKAYLNAIFDELAQRALPHIDHDVSAIEIFNLLWKYTLEMGLEWFDMIKVRYLRDIPDDMFNVLVLNTGLKSVNVMRLVSKDPRFDPDVVFSETHLLLCALEAGLEMVKLLVARGVDLTAVSPRNMTIAQVCAQKGANDILRWLLEIGVDTGVAEGIDSSGQTKCNIWHLAACHSLETFEILVDAGVQNDEELFAVSASGNTPLAELIQRLPTPYAIVRHANAIPEPDAISRAIELLRKIPMKNPRLFQSKTPSISTAARLGSQKLTETLLELGASVSVDTRGASPLHFLCLKASGSFIDYMQRLCSDLSWQDSEGRTPIESIMREQAMTPEEHPPESFEAAMEKLLCSKTTTSTDFRGRHLWERVCNDLVSEFVLQKSPKGHLISDFIDRLVSEKVLEDYEMQSGTSGVKPLLDGLSQVDAVQIWMGGLMHQVLQQTKHEGSLAGAGQTAVPYLKWAANSNTWDLVRLLLKHGASVHEKTFGMSTLESACLSNGCGEPVFDLLLDHADSTKLNDIGYQGLGLVHLQSHGQGDQRLSRLRSLLEKGADPNLRNSLGDPAIVEFLRGEHSQCIDLLLEYGADVNARNNYGMDTALAAISQRNLFMLSKLLGDERFKVDWNATCIIKVPYQCEGQSMDVVELPGSNALHLAAWFGYDTGLDFYLTNKLITDLESATAVTRYRPIHFACRAASITCIKLLVSSGADVKSQTSDGSTGLHFAVKQQREDVVRTLVEEGHPLDVQDLSGQTPLDYALTGGNPVIIDALLGSGGSKNMVTDNTTNSPQKAEDHLLAALFNSILRSDIRLCRTLHDVGCPVHLPMPPCRSCTPLMIAVDANEADICMWLLDTMDVEMKKAGLGAKCETHSNRGTLLFSLSWSSPKIDDMLTKILDMYFDTAENWFHWPVGVLHDCALIDEEKPIDLILAYVATNEDRLRSRFSIPNNTSLCKRLLDHTINTREFGYPYTCGLTPLHLAILMTSPKAAKRLLQAGADPNKENMERRTPLHLAVREGMIDVVRQLLDCGSDLDRLDRRGETPLMVAVDAGRLDCAKLLVEAGADTSLCNRRGESLLHMAGESGQVCLFRYFLELGLDPYKPDGHGASPLYIAMLSGDMISYAINSDFDFHQLAARKQYMRPLLSVVRDTPTTLHLLLRRLTAAHVARALINVWPERHEFPSRYSSPLCNAARAGYMESLKLLLEYGADLEFEGSVEGTALMSASRAGNVEIVSHLVRTGANISYTRNGRVQNALEVGKRFKGVVRWLLVERWTDQRRILPGSCFSVGDVEVRPWSGITTVALKLHGPGERFGQQRSETKLAFLGRMHTLRTSLRGQVVYPEQYL